MTAPNGGRGHGYEINLPSWVESVHGPYNSRLGEVSYEPALHDAAVNRYVRGEEFYTEPYQTESVTNATNFGGQPLKGQTRPDG